MADPQLPIERASEVSIWRAQPIVATLATVGLLALAGGTAVLLYEALVGDGVEFFDTDEAPIRVRNGSIDLFLESTSERWESAGGSGNWKSSGSGEVNGGAYQVLFTVKGGSCPDGQETTGDNVLVTYSDGKQVRLQVVQDRTLVKPENGAMLNRHAKDEQRLTYSAAGGFIREVAVGPPGNPTLTCTFQDAAQLDNVRLRGRP